MSVRSDDLSIVDMTSVDALKFGNGITLFSVERSTTVGDSTNLPNGSIYVDIDANVGRVVNGVCRPFRKMELGGLSVPTAPLNVSAVSNLDGTTATVSFTAPVNDGGIPITSYTARAYRQSDQSDNSIESSIYSYRSPFPSQLSIQIRGLTTGETYIFRVFARNSEGNGPLSDATTNQVSMILTPTAPSSPTEITVVSRPDGTTAMVFFTLPSVEGSSPVTSYTAYAYLASSPTSSVTNATIFAPFSGTPYINIVGLVVGESYIFKVVARNNVGGSILTDNSPTSPSTVMTVVPAFPRAPENAWAIANPNGYSATVLFTPPITDGGSSILSYTAYAYLNGKDNTVTDVISTGTIRSPFSSGQLSIQVDGLTTGLTYNFKVLASNAVGSGLMTSPTNMVTLPTISTIPQMVVGTAKEDGTTDIIVTFNPPVSNGRALITSYTAYAYLFGNSAPVYKNGHPISLPFSSPLSITIPDLISTFTYTFKVMATNSVGDSDLSKESAGVVVPVILPTQPRSIVAGSLANGTTARVSFDAPEKNGGVPINQYTTYSYRVTGGQVSEVPEQSASITDLSVLAIDVPGLVPGAAYVFKVVARNTYNKFSDITQAIPSAPLVLKNVAAPPTGVTSRPLADGRRAQVSWLAPSTDNGAPISSYTVHAYLNGAGSSVSFTKISAPELTAKVVGLTPNSTYTFRVLASNSVGDSARSSPSAYLQMYNFAGKPTAAEARTLPSGDSASVTFTAPINNGGVPITSYVVFTYVVTNHMIANEYVSATTLDMTTNPPLYVVIKDLVPGLIYKFKVWAHNSVGDGELSDPTDELNLVPAQPTNVAATSFANGFGAVVTFNSPPTVAGGVPILSYRAFAYLVTNGVMSSTAAQIVNLDMTVTPKPALSITINNLVPGSIYQYTVLAHNIAGDGLQSEPSALVIQFADKPTGVAADSLPTGFGATVTFVAPAINGAVPITAYVAYAYLVTNGVSSSSAASSAILTMSGSTPLSVVVNDLMPGSIYTYKVAARNGAGDSLLSDVSASPVTQFPDKPTGVTATTLATGFGATVTFTASPFNGDVLVTSYVAYAYLVTNGVSATTAASSATLSMTGNPSLSVVVNNLTPGSIYTYKVLAHNSRGDGLLSVASSPVTQLPDKPTTVEANSLPSGFGATVTFLAPARNGAVPITSYVAYAYLVTNGVSSTSAASSATLNISGSPPLSVVVSNLVPGSIYTYKVLAHNSAGDSLLSDMSASSATQFADKPRNVAATTLSTGAGATVTFSAPAVNGDVPITAYVAYAYLVTNGVSATTAASSATLSMTGNPALSVVVNNLTPGTIYTYKVAARNSRGDSLLSDASLPVTQLPDKPTAVVANSLPSGFGATVTFTAPASNGAVPITSYVAYAYLVTNGVSDTTAASSATLNMSGSPPLSVVVNNLVPGSIYTYKVLAHNSAGDSLLSNVSASSETQFPDQPLNVAATTLSTGLGATVTFSTPAVNGAVPITAYIAYAYLVTNGISATTAASSATLNMSGSQPLSVVVNNLTPGAIYTYKVAAHNSRGDGLLSNDSTQVSQLPDKPRNVTVDSLPSGFGATVTFLAPASNGALPITSYVAYAYLVTSGVSDTTVASSTTLDMTITPTPALSIVINNLTPGSIYTYKVRSRSSVGDSLLSDASTPTTQFADRPTNVAATTLLTGAGATVTFTAPAVNGAVPISAYVAYAYLVTNGVSATTATSSATLNMSGSPALSVVVNGLTPGAVYTYKVSTRNSRGDSVLSQESTTQVSQLPDKPTGLVADSLPTGFGATVTFSAPAVNGSIPITAYIAYAYLVTNGVSAIVADSSATLDMTVTPKPALSIVVPNLVPGSIYTYKVLTHSSAGDSLLSNESAAATQFPDKPTNVASNSRPIGPGSTVTFVAPSRNGSVPITAYVAYAYLVTAGVEAATASSSAVLDMTVTPKPALSIVVYGLTPSSIYNFKVVARNSRGDSLLSDSVQSVEDPDMPTSVSANSLDSGFGATVTFNAPVTNGSEPITGYVAYAYLVTNGVSASNAASSATLDMTLTPKPPLSIVINNLVPSSTYTYRVLAQNQAAGNGPLSDPPAQATQFPDVPTNVAATSLPTGAGATVTFNAPSNQGAVPITAYVAYAYLVTNGVSATSETSSATLSMTGNPALSVVVNGLAPGAIYTYKVSARNARGDSLLSLPSGQFSQLPDQPTAVAANSLSTGFGATVTFSAPANGAVPITAYVAYAYLVTNGTSATTATSSTTLDMTVTPTPALSVVVNGLTPNSIYTYKVLAHNRVGDGLQSIASQPSTQYPGKPTGVSAVSLTSGSSATVTFTAPSPSGSVTIDSYVAYAYLVTGGLSATDATSSATLDMTNSPPLSVVVNGLAQGAVYTYKVLAHNARGNGLLSDPSASIVQTANPPTGVNATMDPIGMQTQVISVTVTFSAPTVNGGAPITAYVAYSYLVTNGVSATTPTSSAILDMRYPVPLSVQVTGLTGGSIYTFKVLSRNNGGDGLLSTNASGPVSLVADKVRGITAISINGGTASQVTVTPPVNGSIPILDYTVEAYLENNKLNAISAAAIYPSESLTSRAIIGLTPGATYVYQVVASSSLGYGLWSDYSASFVQAPEKPTGVSANSLTTGTQAAVTFAAPVMNGVTGAGLTITGYVAYAYLVTNGTSETTATSSASLNMSGSPPLSIVVNDLTSGSIYTFTVLAQNSGGSGFESTPSAQVTLYPGKPTGVSAVSLTVGTGSTVTFTAPVNGSVPINSYVAYAYLVTAGVSATTATSSATLNMSGSPALSVVINGLTPSSIYTYKVMAQSVRGNSLLSDPSASIAQVPAKPTSVSANSITAGTGATVTFTAPSVSAGVTAYVAYAYLVTGGVSATTATSSATLDMTGSPPLSVLVNGLTPGSIYTYKVLARNSGGDGSLSDPSGQISQFPGKPTGVSAATTSATTSTVSFSAPSPNGSISISSYKVYTYKPDNSQLGTAVSTTTLSASITGLSGGEIYTYKVSAVNSRGEGLLSDASGQCTQLPDLPTGVTATSLDTTQSTVTFSAPTNGSSPIIGYEARAFLNGVDTGKFTTSALASDRSLKITGLAAGEIYTYKVRAQNSAGYGAYSNPSAAIAQFPGVPSIVSVANFTSGSGAIVTITAPNPQGSSILSYKVYAYETGTQSIVTFTTSSLPANVTGLTMGSTYTFKVSAFNSSGEGALSGASGSLTLFVLAGKPTGITPTSSADGQTATVRFTAPTSNGGTAIDYYMVYAYQSNWTQVRSAKLNMPATLQVNITPLSKGQYYWFRVSAHNAVGDGPLSDSLGGVTEVQMNTTAPDPPTITSITRLSDGRSAYIYWTNGFNGGVLGEPAVWFKALPSGGTVFTPSGYYYSPNGSFYCYGLTPGTQYTFTAYNTNVNGNSADSAAYTVTMYNYPAAPSFSSSTINSNATQITLNWYSNGDGGAAISTYTIYTYDSNMTNLGSVLLNSNFSSVTLSGNPGSYYTFRIFATNSVGTSQNYGQLGRSMANVPTWNGALTATAYSNGTRIDVSWNTPFTNGSTLRSYALYRYFSNGTYSGIDYPAINVTSYSVTNLSRGTSYYFVLYVNNDIGQSTGNGCPPLTTPNLPDTPTGATATKNTDGSVTVSWTLPGNGGAALDGYEVNGQGGSTTLNVSETGLTTVPTSTTFEAKSLLPNTQFGFTVRAHNSVGWGPITAPVFVTTYNVPSKPYFFADLSSLYTAQIMWKLDDNGGLPVTKWTLTYDAPSGRGSTNVDVSSSTDPNSVMQVFPFGGAGSYFFNAVAYNAMGPSAVSDAYRYDYFTDCSIM